MINVALVILCVINCCYSTQVFLDTPVYSEVNPGQTLLLPCVVANKGGECQWEKDGTPVGMFPSKYEWAGDVESGNCSLLILDLSSEYDDGVWQCQVTASNFVEGDSLISDGAEVVIKADPKDITIINEGAISGSEGDTSDIECVSSGANPPAKLYFELNGKRINGDVNQNNVRLEGGGWKSYLKLSLILTKENHKSTLVCTIDDISNKKLQASTNLNVRYAPEIKDISNDQMINEGEPMSISCKVDSNPEAEVRWRKLDSNKILTDGAIWTVNEVTKADAGSYVCEAENAIGKIESEPVNIKVNHAPVIKSIGPSEMNLVTVDNRLFLTCEAEAVPSPLYRWLQKTTSGDILVVGNEQNLVVENASYDQAGEYVCEASNEIKDRKQTTLSDLVKVEIRGVPKITNLPPEYLKIDNGEDFEVSINYCSNPPSKPSWKSLKNEVIMNTTTRTINHVRSGLHFCYESGMRITNVKSADADEYTLELENEHGLTVHTIKLEVEGSDLPLELICGVSSGVLFIILVILLCLTIRTVRKRRIVKDVESCGTSTISDSDSDQKSDHSNANLFQTRTEKSTNVSSHIVQHTTPASYSELCFPKSSNCGSMRKKKDKHFEDLMNVYNTAIIDNINTSLYASMPRKQNTQQWD